LIEERAWLKATIDSPRGSARYVSGEIGKAEQLSADRHVNRHRMVLYIVASSEADMARTQMKRVPPKCTLEEFNEALAYFSLAPVTIERVRRVLVDGEAVNWVATTENITYPSLSRACDKVMSKVEELRSIQPGVPWIAPGMALPPGWEEATIAAPAEFLADMRKRLDKYLKDHNMAGMKVG
jgi:hypothetical protein